MTSLLSNSSTSSSSSWLIKMLKEIVENDQQNENGFVKVPSIAFWTRLFANYFFHHNNPQHDDLLFYVKKPDDADSPHEVEVYRRESTKLPGLGDPAYEWTETVYLNMILQQLEYTLTCAICTRASSRKQDVLIHKMASQQVYASPSRHSMEKKGKSAELCYPNIFFTVDNFDEVWNDLYLDDDELVCVEILASDKSKAFSTVLFLGSVNYDALNAVYDKRTKNTNKWTQVMSLGLLRNNNTVEFVRMKGPNGKGYAEMAIQKSNHVTQSASTSSLSQDDEQASVGTHPVRQLSSSKSDSNLATDSTSLPERDTPSHSRDAQSRMSKKKNFSSSLKTQLTYVTLPWHKIILDILRTYEKPSEAKKSVLTRKKSSK